MKKMMLALVLTLVGLGLSTESVARSCGRSCRTECAPKCNSKCGEVTYSESGEPCCIKRFVSEHKYPANKHVHTAYTCPSDCIEMDGEYQCQVNVEIN